MVSTRTKGELDRFKLFPGDEGGNPVGFSGPFGKGVGAVDDSCLPFPSKGMDPAAKSRRGSSPLNRDIRANRNPVLREKSGSVEKTLNEQEYSVKLSGTFFNGHISMNSGLDDCVGFCRLLFSRVASRRIETALRDTPVVFVVGPR